MKVVVKTIKGQKTEIDCESTTLISDIKKIIEEKMEIEIENQKLIFKGKHLDDDKTLEELSIKDNDCFVLMVLKKKTIKTKEPNTNEENVVNAPVEETNPPANPFENPNIAPAQPQIPPQQVQPPSQLDPNNEILRGHAEKEEIIKDLVDMGFERVQVEQCLTAAFYNKEVAVNYLLNGIPQHILNEMTQPQAQTTQQPGQQTIQMSQQQLQTLQQLANSPAFVQIRQQAQNNPAIIPQFLTIMQQQNPSLYNLFMQNPQLLSALLTGNIQAQEQTNPTSLEGFQENLTGNEDEEEEDMSQNNPEHVVELSEEDYEAVQTLKEFGFSEQQCIEAYLICNKNRDWALNYLLDNQNN
jgi:UV excision repair protein RAD23